MPRFIKYYKLLSLLWLGFSSAMTLFYMASASSMISTSQSPACYG